MFKNKNIVFPKIFVLLLLFTLPLALLAQSDYTLIRHTFNAAGGHQCRGVWLAVADVPFPHGLRGVGGACAVRGDGCRRMACAEVGAHAAIASAEGVRA